MKDNYVDIRTTVGSFLSRWLASIVGEVSCCQGGLILPDVSKEAVEHLIGLSISGQSGWLNQSMRENLFTLTWLRTLLLIPRRKKICSHSLL